MDSKLIVTALRTELIGGEFTLCRSAWGEGGRKIHNDPFSRLYWIRKGKGEIDYIKGRIILEPGKLIVIPSFTPARYFCEDGMELYWIHFRADLFGSQEIFKLMNWNFTVKVQNQKIMTDFMKNLILSSSSKKLEDSFSSDIMLRQLLCRFASEKEDVMNLQDVQRFLPAIVYIEQNLHRKITLKDLIKVVPLESAYFCSLFSKTIGESPMHFINRKKIEKSQFLMENKELSLKEIAGEVGFEDVYYYSRVFKNIVGIAPLFYRKQEKF